MFDWYEQIYDIILFSIFFSILWEVFTVMVSVTEWSTAAPAWQVSIVTFSWEKIPLVFILSLILRGFVRSQLRQVSEVNVI